MENIIPLTIGIPIDECIEAIKQNTEIDDAVVDEMTKEEITEHVIELIEDNLCSLFSTHDVFDFNELLS